MASSKRIGFYWGEEKITVVEFDKNLPQKVVSAPLGSKTATPSPFSSNLTEEIQITAILQKMLQDNKITGGSYYVSLPMKEIILRSFIIPFVKNDEIQNIVKFEAKKYIPFDIQDLVFVYYTIPFMEDRSKRLQVIFFAARKEVLARYERIFKQVNAQIAYCEPYMVSLSKALLFKKEIKPTDQLAFLILDKTLGRICFIDQGIPQFIREFPLGPAFPSEDSNESAEDLNLKIVNEVGNSFDFYARQFSGDRIDQMLVASDFVQDDLMKNLELELKVKLRKFSPVAALGTLGQINDLESVFAMGACVTPPIDSLFKFNFLSDKNPKSQLQGGYDSLFKKYKEVLLVLVFCLVLLSGLFFYFYTQLKATQHQYDQLSAKQGEFTSTPVDSIQSELQQNTDLLTQYQGVRRKSNLAFILLKVSSHLPQGALLNGFDVKYEQADNNNTPVSISMSGVVLLPDFNQQVAVVNQVFSDLKNDKDLSTYFKTVSLASLDRQSFKGKQVTGFNITCS